MPITRPAHAATSRLAAGWLEYDRTGCPRRRDELVLALLPIVRAIVAHACPDDRSSARAASLEAAGLDGLLAAVETHEPAGGASLEQHAWTTVVTAVRNRMPQPPQAFPLAA